MSSRMMPDDDADAVGRARTGDLEAFNELVLRHQDAAFNVAYRLLGDPDTAADMTQDALIAAYRKLDTYHNGSFRAWLLRIVSNRCLDELRRVKRHRTDYLDDLTPDSDDGAAIPSPLPTPEQAAQQNELHRLIQDCINALGADQRVTLVLCDVQGLSYQEIAESTQTHIGTVKSRLARARAAMRACLQASQELLPLEFRLFK
ncbi:sigma-70 family RNA polymerase sigma factor [Aggregatilineales bacterium SYSU G02658]